MTSKLKTFKNIKSLVVIGGPTAVGKTDIASRLYRRHLWPILSADSRQMYREMSIGTAKPTKKERNAVPQYFIDTLSVHEDYDAGRFESEALDLLEDLYKTHRVCMLCGGSGLYLKAVLQGFDAQPSVPPAFRDHWTEVFQTQGLHALQHALKRLDPIYFAKVDQKNPRRLIRALAVCTFTGQPFSKFLRSEPVPRPFDPILICLTLPREDLYDRINRRVDHMLDQGLVDEAKALYPQKHLNSLQTVGYQELFLYFDGVYTLAEAIDKIKQHTRNYAKRQMTWFRNQGNWTMYHPENFERIERDIFNRIQT